MIRLPFIRVARFALAAALLIVAALAAAPDAAAQGTLNLKIEDAIALGQRQGFAGRSAASIREAARARDKLFYTQFLPSLSIGGNSAPSYTRSITPVIQPDGTTLYRPLQQTSAGLTASLIQRVPWTNTQLNFTSGLSQVQVSGVNGFRTWSSTPFQIGINQPIFRANTQRWDIQQQDLKVTSAERKFLESREDVSIAVTNAYFDLHSATLTLKNAEANAAINDTLYTLNKGRLEVGKIGENDLLQSELALLRARSALEDSHLALSRALAQFRITLNLAPATPVSILVTNDVPRFEADTIVAVQQARRNSSLMSDAAATEVQADRSVSEARWTAGAGGNLSASYGYNAIASKAPDAYKNLLDAQQLQLAVQIPVWQWGAHSAQVQAAKADRNSAQSLAQNSRAQVENNAHFAALQIGQTRRALAIAAKADTVAQRRFEVALNRYSISKITIDNLFIAQNEKDQALSTYVQALRGYWLAYFQLRKATLFDFEKGQVIQ
jgi:outer membrane protein TolC